MKLPRDLSGSELIKLLCKHFGYRRVNQEGSHVILETTDPRQHRIAIPDILRCERNSERDSTDNRHGQKV